MPIYEYKCGSCEKTFEYMQKMSDDRLVTCEACGKDTLERLISATSFTLKGSGWYKDLYSSPKPAADKTASETKSDSGGSATGASESKKSTDSSSSGSSSKPASSGSSKGDA